MDTPTPTAVLAGRLPEIRKLRGVSQSQLAAQLNVERKMIARTEAGQREVPLDQALALAAALDISPVALFLPLDGNDEVEIGGRNFTARDARVWFRGENPLPDRDPRRFRDVVPDSDRHIADDPSLNFLAEMFGYFLTAAVVEEWDDVEYFIEQISTELARMRARLERRPR